VHCGLRLQSLAAARPGGCATAKGGILREAQRVCSDYSDLHCGGEPCKTDAEEQQPHHEPASANRDS